MRNDQVSTCTRIWVTMTRFIWVTASPAQNWWVTMTAMILVTATPALAIFCYHGKNNNFTLDHSTLIGWSDSVRREKTTYIRKLKPNFVNFPHQRPACPSQCRPAFSSSSRCVGCSNCFSTSFPFTTPSCWTSCRWPPLCIITTPCLSLITSPHSGFFSRDDCRRI